MKHQKTRYGEMIFPAQDSYVGKSLERYGEAQYFETEFLLDLIEAGAEDVFVDVGAGIGNVTVPMAKKIGSEGYVLALEAQSFVYHTLCGNLALNHLGNVQAFNRAISDVSNTHCFYPNIDPRSAIDFRDISLSTLLNADDEHGRKCEQPVATLCLDDLRLAKPKVIKIDISGMEFKALKGMKRTIQRSEALLFVRSKTPNKEIMEFLHSLEYDWEVHAPAVYNKDNFFNKRDNIFEDEIARSYLFSYPKGKRPDVSDSNCMKQSDSRFAAFEEMKEQVCGSTVS